MDIKEIVKEKALKYLDLVEYLKKKYGEPKGNYFLTITCKSVNNKIKKAKEGLTIHHVKENEHIDLSKTEYASQHDFSYQEAKNLVYCNPLEHLLLHKKIVEEYLFKSLEKGLKECVGIGGVLNYIVPQFNSYFFENGFVFASYQLYGFEIIKNNKNEYLEILADIAKTVKRLNDLYPNNNGVFNIEKLWSSGNPTKIILKNNQPTKGQIAEVKKIILKTL